MSGRTTVVNRPGTWDEAQGLVGLTGSCCYPVLEIQGVLPQGHETGAFCRRESDRAFKEDGVSGEASLSRTRMTRHSRITALIKTPTSLAGLSAKLQAPFSYNETESKVCGRQTRIHPREDRRIVTSCVLQSKPRVIDKRTGRINHLLISTLVALRLLKRFSAFNH